MKTQKLSGTLFAPSISCRDSILKTSILGLLKPGRDEPGYWEIKGKYAALKDVTIICIVYRIGDTVVFAEIDDDLSPNFIDPLVTKYGFDNVKWIVVPSKR